MGGDQYNRLSAAYSLFVVAEDRLAEVESPQAGQNQSAVVAFP